MATSSWAQTKRWAGSGSTARSCPAPCAAPCPIVPCVPDQGGIMPLLWQPTVQTSLASLSPTIPAAYTLVVIATQRIDRGIVLRFQMWDGQNFTYEDAANGASGGAPGAYLAEWDLIVQQTIEAGTVLVVSMRETGTALWGYTGSTIYASNGAGIPAACFTVHSSLLCFAFAPTVTGQWSPALGMPMFAIGFNHPDPPQMGSSTSEGDCGAPTVPGSPQASAPNFPDQYGVLSSTSPRWTFTYEVVYPIIQPININLNPLEAPEWVCAPVLGIKFEGAVSKHTAGSWSNLRDIIAQPWTVIKDTYLSVNNWQYYSILESFGFPRFVSPDTGPFVPSLEPGQLVPVYWKPKYKNINTDTDAISGSSPLSTTAAQLALLVTSPIAMGTAVYFTNDAYDAENGGFGPRSSGTGSAVFVDNLWSFVWNSSGTRVIPAGTVVFLDNIGGVGPITIVDAHNTALDVGSITIPFGGDGTIQDEDVVSLIALGAWFPWGVGSSRPLSTSMFVCAALSDQYAGDFPPLSPCLTISRTRYTGQVIFGRRKIFDNRFLPGTVQNAIIHSSTFTSLPWNTIVLPEEMPVFKNMGSFSW